MKSCEYEIYSFYRFIKLNNKRKLKLELDKFLGKTKIKGTILLADEGINASISGSIYELDQCLSKIKSLLNIRLLKIKKNLNKEKPFNRMKVRLKKEIVSLGIKNLDVNKFSGESVSPAQWDNYIAKKDVTLIDVRNNYEINIGNFKGSINPKTSNFREFPKKLSLLKIEKDANIFMYCTGGIRCEKASAYLNKQGFNNVKQLEGGILNYLNYKKTNKSKSKWQGECFVFDDRVSVNKNLLKGKFTQCYGCRRPLSNKDVKSENFKKGIYCPYCIDERTEQQIKNSTVRQKQIDLALKKKESNPFIKK
tara:strand:- start:1063 stop:1986 length:924 start_codon:yes stop_codon:yes gene_type:complete